MNLLAHETSPYLLQHKDNPVHWRPWGPAALAEAKASGKPILLSVGYAACHWCHVMAHESFEDAETAALMNAHYVNIKVDREERPDIDTIYQAALAAMGQQGGWPLTMFLTSDAEPFAGGTYFPPEAKFGRPAFRQVLADVAKVHAEQGEPLVKGKAMILERLTANWGAPRAAEVTRGHIDFAARRVTQAVDMFLGGLDGAPKFPQTPVFEMLWRAFLRTGARPFGQAVTTTLDGLCQGGIYDHLGGGFARYAVDERWLVPHFEKMLYDNAVLLDLLTLVWQQTRNPLYAQRVGETAEWLLREMVTPDGGFASSLDADSEGEEGRFYVWSEAEIDAVLGAARSGLFKQVYDVTAAGNWEGKTILHRLRAPNYLQPEQEAVLAGQRRQLLQARAARVRPGLDDKVLADWNGLMIAALANAAAVFQKPEWHVAAVRAFWMVAEKMAASPEGGTLYHSWRDGRPGPAALAEDYANLIRAALVLFETTQDPRYLTRAKLWAFTLGERFWDKTNGGYFTTPADAEGLIVRIRQALDHPVPAANGTMVANHVRLHALTGDPDHRSRAEAIVTAFGGDIQRNFVGAATLLNGFDMLLAAVQIVIVRAPNDPRAQPLVRKVYDKSLPNRVLQIVAPEAGLPPDHPAHGKPLLNGLPTAYLCIGTVCSTGITELSALDQALSRSWAAA